MSLESHRINPHSEIIFTVPSPLDTDGLDPRLSVPPVAHRSGGVNTGGIIPCRVLPGTNRESTQPHDILPATDALIIPGIVGLRGLERQENRSRFTLVDHTLPSATFKPLFDEQGRFLPENLDHKNPIEARTSFRLDHALLEVVHFAEETQGIVPRGIGRIAVVCGSYFGPGSVLYGDVFTSEAS